MDKTCNHCKKSKPIGEYFTAPKDGAASWQGTSEFCKQCHSEGKIKHGYGYYGDKFVSPETTK
jgi:hypothetical protein